MAPPLTGLNCIEMKILILSAEKQQEIHRITDEAKRRGHKITFRILKKGLKINPDKFDVLLLRAIIGNVKLAERIAEKFYLREKPVVDEKLAKKIDRNKMENYIVFMHKHLYVPKTEYFTKSNLIKIKKFDSEWIVLKPLSGKRGIGIERIHKNELESRLKKFGETTYLAQEFAEIKKEYRVYVIDGKAIGGMEKVSKNWIHNIYQGAKPKKAILSTKIKEVAIDAAKSVETEIAGCDIGTTKKGLFVIEVNRSPGFAGYESLGKKFAVEIVKYVERKLKK